MIDQNRWYYPGAQFINRKFTYPVTYTLAYAEEQGWYMIGNNDKVTIWKFKEITTPQIHGEDIVRMVGRYMNNLENKDETK